MRYYTYTIKNLPYYFVIINGQRQIYQTIKVHQAAAIKQEALMASIYEAADIFISGDKIFKTLIEAKDYVSSHLSNAGYIELPDKYKILL